MAEQGLIGLVDYGAGNLLSVRKAFEYLKIPVKLVNGNADFQGITKLVLPGVGAFESAVNHLHDKDLFFPVKNWILEDKPFLGICLGLQLLFESSEESKNCIGLSIFKGISRKFQQGKIPQIGWNQVDFVQEDSIFDSISRNSFFYFLHSYYVVTEDETLILGKTSYGTDYTSLIRKGNVYGIQFHPEKSGQAGIQMLKNWSLSC